MEIVMRCRRYAPYQRRLELDSSEEAKSPKEGVTVQDWESCPYHKTCAYTGQCSLVVGN